MGELSIHTPKRDTYHKKSDSTKVSLRCSLLICFIQTQIGKMFVKTLQADSLLQVWKSTVFKTYVFNVASRNLSRSKVFIRFGLITFDDLSNKRNVLYTFFPPQTHPHLLPMFQRGDVWSPQHWPRQATKKQIGHQSVWAPRFQDYGYHTPRHIELVARKVEANNCWHCSIWTYQTLVSGKDCLVMPWCME